MKELSVEEKAKRYDEAIKRAGNLHKDAVEMENNMTSKTCEIIFPELKESENERIRKGIISLIEFGLDDKSAIAPGYNITKEEAIAWLEKQGKMLDADKVIEWLDEHVPTKFEDMQNYVNQFKKDFKL